MTLIKSSDSDTNRISLGLKYGLAVGSGELPFWDSLYNEALKTNSDYHIAKSHYWLAYMHLRKGMLDKGLEMMLENERHLRP